MTIMTLDVMHNTKMKIKTNTLLSKNTLLHLVFQVNTAFSKTWKVSGKESYFFSDVLLYLQIKLKI